MTGIPPEALDAGAAAEETFFGRNGDLEVPAAQLGREVTRVILEATAPVIAAAERERWLAVLADHYLMGVNCNPDTKQDNPMCGCSRIHLGWHDSIGAARQAWLDHVAAVVAEHPPEVTS